jgi:hypothetical protein
MLLPTKRKSCATAAVFILSYVCLCLVIGATEKAKGGVRFATYGALELVLPDNPHSFLGLLWTVP